MICYISCNRVRPLVILELKPKSIGNLESDIGNNTFQCPHRVADIEDAPLAAPATYNLQTVSVAERSVIEQIIPSAINHKALWYLNRSRECVPIVCNVSVIYGTGEDMHILTSVETELYGRAELTA